MAKGEFIKNRYMEKMEISHVMKDLFHLFIEVSQHNDEDDNVKILVRKHHKWMTPSSIHHLVL